MYTKGATKSNKTKTIDLPNECVLTVQLCD